jgi:endonuclease/exonuclease/phosphatase (EEP) superfamily protein YafD
MDARVGAAVEHVRGAAPGSTGRSWRRKWAIRLGCGAAVVYPCALVVAWALLRLAGESWWISTIGLYLPRAVLAAPLPVIALALAGLRRWRWLWTQAAAALVLTFPVMGFVVPWPHSADPAAPRLRVLTYNINSCHGGCDAIIQEVDRYSPDVVLMQEVAHVDELEPLLRSRYPTVEVSTQFVVASRFPVLARFDPPKLPVNGADRSARWVQRVLDTPLGPIAFYDVHPASPRDDFSALRGRGLRREISSGHLFSGDSAPLIANNVALRETQVQSFSAAAANESGPVIIAGDTNLPGLSKILGRYLSSYHDGFREAGWGLGYTYPNDHKPFMPHDRNPWMRIDRVFTSDELRVVGFEVGTSPVSDHLCVIADIQRRTR